MVSGKILIQPVISEKSYKAAQDGTYMFVVNSVVSKKQIEQAVEKQFKVSVTSVPTITTRRNTVLVDKKALGPNKPLKSLTRGKKAVSARNNLGRITMRHRGGG